MDSGVSDVADRLLPLSNLQWRRHCSKASPGHVSASSRSGARNCNYRRLVGWAVERHAAIQLPLLHVLSFTGPDVRWGELSAYHAWQVWECLLKVVH
jgi:hypothetical protein